MRSRYLLIIIAAAALAGCSVFQKSIKPLPKPEMAYVNGSTFTMGNQWDSLNTDALPVHSVTIDDFFIGTHEITVAQYNAYTKRIEESPADTIKSEMQNIPATRITWDEAKAYCRHFGFRLPTEQEWEFAARSGGEKRKFSGTNQPDSLFRYAHIENPRITKPMPVGIKEPNDLGLYDMSGNVFEWIGDYYQFYPEEGTEPEWDDLDERIMRIIRGGSYDQPAAVASTYWRAGMLHDTKASDVGFRCAADADKSLSAVTQ